MTIFEVRMNRVVMSLQIKNLILKICVWVGTSDFINMFILKKFFRTELQFLNIKKCNDYFSLLIDDVLRFNYDGGNQLLCRRNVI